MGPVCVCIASLVLLSSSISKSVIPALLFPIFSWRDFALAAANPSSPDFIDLKIFSCEEGIWHLKADIPILVVSLPFSLSAQHSTVLASSCAGNFLHGSQCSSCLSGEGILYFDLIGHLYLRTLNPLASLTLRILKFIPCFQFRFYVSYTCLLKTMFSLPLQYSLAALDSSFGPAVILR